MAEGSRRDKEKKAEATAHLGGIGAAMTFSAGGEDVSQRFSEENRQKSEKVGSDGGGEEAEVSGDPGVDELAQDGSNGDGAEDGSGEKREDESGLAGEQNEGEAQDKDSGAKEDVVRQTTLHLSVENVLKPFQYWSSRMNVSMSKRINQVLEKEVKKLMKELRQEFGDSYIDVDYPIWEEKFWPGVQKKRGRK